MTTRVVENGLRGGAWYNNVAVYVRAVYRDWYGVTSRDDSTGFRLTQKT